MKFIRVILLLSALGLSAFAQQVNVTANKIKGNSAAPAASCTSQQVYLKTDGTLYTCASGTMTAVGSPAGVVTGPGSSTDNAVVRFDGTGGATVQNSVVLIGDTGAITGALSLSLAGTGGAGFVSYPTQSSAPSAPATGFTEYADSTGRKSWIRASDGFTRTWDATLTANRVYTLPDATTTIAGLAVAQTFTAAQTITANSGTIFAAGRQGTTNPALAVASSGGTDVTGISVTAAAAGSGVTVGVTSSGSNESLTLAPKGTGNVTISTGSLLFPSPPAGVVISSIGSSTNTRYLQFQTTGGQFYLGIESSIAGGLWTGALPYSSSMGTSNNTALQFATNNNVRATFDGTGLLGIGTNAPSGAQVEIDSQSTTRPSLKLRALSGTAGTQTVLESYDAAGTLTASLLARGSIVLADNAVATPAVRGSDTDSGIYFSGNNTRFAVDGTDAVAIAGGGIPLRLAGALGFGATSTGTQDVTLFRDSAGALSQHDTTNPQRFNLSNTFTSASVREDLSFYWSSNVAHIGATTTGATARVLQLDFGGTTTAAISIPITSGAVTFGDGGVALGKTITAGGTTGDQTINKSSFTVNFAAAATAITVTNSLVATTSNVICTAQTNDTTLKSVAAAPGSGSVVLTANAAATAETRVGCVIYN